MKAVSNESDLSLVESTASMSDTSFIKTSSGMVIDDVGVTDISVLAEPGGGVSEDSTDASVAGDELSDLAEPSINIVFIDSLKINQRNCFRDKCCLSFKYSSRQ